MAYRSFPDGTGVDWNVWDVVPRWVERRVSQRRSAQVAPGNGERRHVPDRRVRSDPREPRVRVSAGYELGWLTFASGDEKRRFAPIPTGWERAPTTLLEALCRQAEHVPRIGGRLIE